MIAHINGRISDVGTQSVIVDVNGVGYSILLPVPLLLTMIVGKDVFLVTYHHIRENGQDLFGFDSVASKKLFELLISVSGVGPKSALNIMALGSTSDIKKAIASQNIAYISTASGIGKKSAERICVELKDKVGVGLDVTTNNFNQEDEAQSALIALGYSASQAVNVLSGIDTSQTTEQRLRQALKELSR